MRAARRRCAARASPPLLAAKRLAPEHDYAERARRSALPPGAATRRGMQRCCIGWSRAVLPAAWTRGASIARCAHCLGCACLHAGTAGCCCCAASASATDAAARRYWRRSCSPRRCSRICCSCTSFARPRHVLGGQVGARCVTPPLTLHLHHQGPPVTFFGFCFLLVFVFATIPAGIYGA
jgi:hypothetical protein